MRSLKFFLVSLTLICAGFLVISCAEKALNKAQQAQVTLASAEDQAAADAVKAGNAANAAIHTAAANAARARAVQLEAQRAAAQAADNNSWTGGIGSATSLANLLFPGAGALVGVLGTLITQRLRGTTYTNGLGDGATTATTAITNADTANALQAPEVKSALVNNLVGADPTVVAAVHAAI